jgi:hypothetical protein
MLVEAALVMVKLLDPVVQVAVLLLKQFEQQVLLTKEHRVVLLLHFKELGPVQAEALLYKDKMPQQMELAVVVVLVKLLLLQHQVLYMVVAVAAAEGQE